MLAAGPLLCSCAPQQLRPQRLEHAACRHLARSLWFLRLCASWLWRSCSVLSPRLAFWLRSLSLSAFPFLPAPPLGARGGGRLHAWAAAPGPAGSVPRGSLPGARRNASIPAKRAFPGLLHQRSRALIGFIMTQNDYDLYRVCQEGCRCHFESLLSCGKGTTS